MKDFLVCIGGLSLGFVIFFIVICICSGIRELISRLRRNYQIKHRFDKPPTAECYCVDCKRHNNESKRCYKFNGWYTADEWFCWDAEPRKETDK